jgi:hypothetical protein
MESPIRVRLYRTGALCALIVSGCSGVLGLSLLVEVLAESGSREGNTLLATFGLTLLLISLFTLFVSGACWDLLQSRSGDTSFLNARFGHTTRDSEERLE